MKINFGDVWFAERKWQSGRVKTIEGVKICEPPEK